MLIRTLSLLVLPVLAVACGASIKDIAFDVQENGKTVTVRKFYNDGFGGDNAAHRAYVTASQNDFPGAKKILADDIVVHPTDSWNHYNLAILDEASGDYAGAEAELLLAQKTDEANHRKPAPRYGEEILWVRAHKK